MWAFKYSREESRDHVPGYRNFMRANQTLLKLWYEDINEPHDLRMSFSQRCMRFIATSGILFIITYLVINPNDVYFESQCNRRLECYNSCNMAFFPELACKELDRVSFYYEWNLYTEFYLFMKPEASKHGEKAVQDYDQCKAYILDNEYYPDSRVNSHRQIRTHTCFSYCANGDDPAFLGDDRPQCIDIAPELRDQIICVHPHSKCEVTTTEDQIEIFGARWVLSPYAGLLAVILAAPISFAFDICTIILMTWKVNKDSAKESCQFLTFQVFMVLVFVYVICQTIFFSQITLRYGLPSLIYFTYILAFAVSQIIEFPLLSLIYLVIVRRFGYLKINEKEWLDMEAYKDKHEKAVPKLKQNCMQMLEHPTTEGFSFLVINMYAVFILFDLTFTDIFYMDPVIMAKTDSVFLTFFFAEICLKTFASSGAYLVDFFNSFDAAIVVISEILNLMGITAKGLGVLRLIRVVVFTIRKITGSQSKLRHAAKNENPVDWVIKILYQVNELPDISNAIKKEAKFCIGIIEDNKLFDLSMDMSNEEKNTDMEAKAWLNITTETANDTTTWFERDLDDFLKELHREAEEVDPAQQEEEEERLKQIVQLPPRTWTALSKSMDNFDKWDFDVLNYHETLQEQSLVHFGFKLFQMYGLLEKFSISDQNYVALLGSIREATYDNNSYHNVVRVIEVTRNFHYFTKHGELMTYFSDLNVMAGFLASMLFDISHPGVNNNFLIAMKHTKALRYNDKAVLENHHCAIAFKLLLDPQNDIFELLSEAQYWNVRQIILKMILSSDLSNHFSQIMAFKGRLSSKKFPEDTSEDKQLILNFTLYASDHCNPCKPALLYFKWLTAEMEEYYQQGDLERKLEYSISPFFDRTQSNPFKFQLGYIDVVVMPLMTTLAEFKNIFHEQLIVQGLVENRKFLEAKIEETKAFVKEQGAAQKEADKKAEKDGKADLKTTGGAAGTTNTGVDNKLTPQPANAKADSTGVQLKNLGAKDVK